MGGDPPPEYVVTFSRCDRGDAARVRRKGVFALGLGKRACSCAESRTDSTSLALIHDVWYAPEVQSELAEFDEHETVGGVVAPLSVTSMATVVVCEGVAVTPPEQNCLIIE